MCFWAFLDVKIDTTLLNMEPLPRVSFRIIEELAWFCQKVRETCPLDKQGKLNMINRWNVLIRSLQVQVGWVFFPMDRTSWRLSLFPVFPFIFTGHQKASQCFPKMFNYSFSRHTWDQYFSLLTTDFTSFSIWWGMSKKKKGDYIKKSSESVASIHRLVPQY